MKTIYLDYNATTPSDPEVIDAMKPYLDRYFGNPSSMHRYGIETRKAVEKAREQVAALLHASPDEIIFTSGGTESNNMAIKGIALAHASRGKHIITTSVEHPATLEVCRYLENQGYKVTYVDPDEKGTVHASDLEKAVRQDTILLTMMHANNEVGTIQPVEEAGKLAARHGIFFHTDAAQSAGKIPVDVNRMNVQMLSLAGHKLYSPKGIGALYIRKGTVLEKLIHGADHERNLRAGTENVLEIVGLGKACEIALRDLEKNMRHMQQMRDRLMQGITERIPGIRINGDPANGLPNTLSVSFLNLEAETILSGLPGVAASAGAACHAEHTTVSHVLQAMRVPDEYARGTIRFSVGKPTTQEEIDTALEALSGLVNSLRPEKTEPPTGTGQDMSNIALTAFTSGLGCACKMRQQALEKLLASFPASNDPRVLVNQSTSDDATIFMVSKDIAVVQTLDFFTPIVNDPYHFGAIAAANALSDIYAMGGTPLFALNMVGFPSSRLPVEVLEQILKGATDKCLEAEIEILGGHTIDDPEPKFGLVVTGTVDPMRILRNNGSRPGDVILLTKPIGTGIITTGIKRKAVSPELEKQVIGLMSELNRKAAEILSRYPVSACTDVTGFGLPGHLYEMVRNNGTEAEIFFRSVPLIEGVEALARAGLIPGGTRNNLAYLEDHIIWSPGISMTEKLVLCDAQTSGGLLFTLPETEAEQVIRDLHSAGIKRAGIIGRITRQGKGLIHVTK
ncbi:MAG TPA: selenide, water dikinase SelD [Bacteroidetes bacterium]|nr:selenide, water dikinase SelD [Bacteroidota bacterium]